MPRWLRWIGMGAAGLVGLLVVALFIVYVLSGRKLNETYDVNVALLSAAPTDDVIEEGNRLARMRGCIECHGEDLGGQIIFDNFIFGRVAASNLTSGQGGVGASFSDADWVRAVRHGVSRDGKPLVIMPSDEFYYLNDADLGAIIAYARSLPPVDRIHPDKRLGPVARYIIASGAYVLPAASIDHASRPSTPEPGVSLEYGEYLSRTCRGCHGDDLGGREPDGGGSPPGPNLTTGGGTAEWSEADFTVAMRTGVRPDGSELAEEMPWRWVAEMSDDELKALWMYLRSVPSVTNPEPE